MIENHIVRARTDAIKLAPLDVAGPHPQVANDDVRRANHQRSALQADALARRRLGRDRQMGIRNVEIGLERDVSGHAKQDQPWPCRRDRGPQRAGDGPFAARIVIVKRSDQEHLAPATAGGISPRAFGAREGRKQPLIERAAESRCGREPNEQHGNDERRATSNNAEHL